MFSINQNGDRWDLLDASGAVLSSHATYDHALTELGGLLSLQQAQLAAMDSGGDDGLLADTWVSPIAFLSEPTGPGRDFTECAWSWRDPAVSLLPLMLHTETDMGHFGAQLAGFITTIALADGTGSMVGRFYDNENGRAARDLLLGGRRFGVSVDPGEETEVEERCVEEDEDGWCVRSTAVFIRYEVIGLTMTPFPGFARAYIELGTAATGGAEGDAEGVGEGEGEGDEAAASAARPAPAAAAAACCDSCSTRAAARSTGGARQTRAMAAGSVRSISGGPVTPPAAWFADPGLSRLTPLTITPEGEVYGHLAPWGQCHTGYQGECVVTPISTTGYAYFRLGSVLCDDGSEVATGRLTYGGGHADLSLSFRGAVEHYDNAGNARADVAAGEDAHGVWFHGALRPGVTEEQVRELRASSLSGDWRPVGSGLEMVAALAVNSPGLPIVRVASGGRVTAMVAAGARVMDRLALDPTTERIDRLERQLASMHAEHTAAARARLRGVGRQAARARLTAPARERLRSGR